MPSYRTVQLSLQLDLPAVYGISYASVDKLKQLLVVLSESVTLKPNVSKLSGTLNTCRALEYIGKGDFLLDRQITIRVGGSNKSRQQPAGLENAYVASDGLEVGYSQKVPLWMFGMLY